MDPITFEIIRHRLFRVIEEGVITLKHVSGSEITCEGHDLMVALHRADGSLLLAGIGYLHHTPSAAEACKHIVRRFAGEIDEHDVFLLNDPYTAAHHTSDIYLISPIHHEGRLVAWSSSFVHVNDIGATNPGGFCPDATEIYVEGFSSPGIKLIARGELRQDLLDTICNMVRSPALVTLDLKSMIACHNVAKERMQALYGKYGAATVDEACAALIEQSDRRFGQRLEELPDGRWQSRQRLHCRGEDYLVALTMTKEGGRLTFDFSGTSEQSRYAINSPYWATWGAIFSPIFSVLCPDMVWNEGLTRRVTMVAPEGSIIHSRRPAPISVSTIATVPMVNWSSLHCISKMLATSPRHERYATAVWDGGYNAVFMFGRDQRGNYTIGYMTDVFGGAGGARSYADGVDVGGDIPNPITRTANVETTEARLPLRYLFRRRVRDAGGAGRHRGGAGIEYAVTPHDAPDGGLRFVMTGKGTRFPTSEGIGGGYVGSPPHCFLVHAPQGDAEPGRFGTALDELAGEREAIAWGEFPLMGRDVLYVGSSGGGGWGDPLMREPDAVLGDVRGGLTSVRDAGEIYGVVFDAQATQVDAAATHARRDAIRAARGVPAAAE